MVKTTAVVISALILTATALSMLTEAAPRSSESISLNPTTAGGPHYGNQVTFNVVTSMTTPWVVNRCYRGGVLVYEQFAGLFPQALQQQPFVLGYTPAWTSGGASCVGSLVSFDTNGRERMHATTNYDVSP